jgi:hypothetical protein
VKQLMAEPSAMVVVCRRGMTAIAGTGRQSMRHPIISVVEFAWN